MKKIFMLATAAFLVSGVAFAQDKTEKKCAKGKDCCKKDCKKDAKATTKTAKVPAKPAAAKKA
jgi:hypothetical protein